MRIASDNLGKWDHRFLGLAEYISKWSKDPSTKFGCVIAREKRIVSIGYNGLPQGIADDDRLNNRELKYQLIVHGERNAIIFATESLLDTIIYCYPLMPCPACAGMIIQAGIRRVVAPEFKEERWQKQLDITRAMFDEAGVELIEVYQVPKIGIIYQSEASWEVKYV